MRGVRVIPATPGPGGGGSPAAPRGGPGAERPVPVAGRPLPMKQWVPRSNFIEGKQPGAGMGRERGQRGVRVEGAAGAGGWVNLPFGPTFPLMGNKKR